MLPQQYCLRWKYHHSNLQTMFSQLLDRGCFCDVTLACDGQIIRAHRVVLCACSTFFDTILTNYATDKDPIIIMKDAKYADVKYLVEFMYKGEINVEHANLASLLKTAEELKIKGLAEVSWRDDDAMDQPIAEPETKLHGCSASQEKELSAHQFNNYMNNNNNNINAIDEISQIPNHRIPRMPLLTPIPSPNQNLDQFSLKRKRGRPPLDDTYDIFSAQKISQIKSLSSGIHNISATEKNNINSNSFKRVSPNRDNSDMNSLITETNQLVNNETEANNIKGDAGNLKEQKLQNKDWSKRKSQENSQDNDSEIDEKPSVEQLEKSVAAAVAAASANEVSDSNEKNDTNNQNITENVQTGNEYFDDIDDASLLDSQNNGEDEMSDGQEHDSGELGDTKHYVLTQAELEEWKDVIKMDAYLAIGRRPQFWEEPFTKRVLEAIKTKKLEMKKAAQVLGVSYGTLYGRYREVYGCLKHPYR
ncbi:protein tramtrack, beta isoform isoform X2 [Condylostylus longicornis]|nr:protein tramtrack, beta isoform isoform X2 [Condylostylus longicornis]